MTERERYLKENWSPYPAAPAETVSVAQVAASPKWWGGEIVSLSPTDLILHAQGCLKKFHFSEAKFYSEGIEAPCLDVLQPKDKVAVRLESETIFICLLAPCLARQSSLPLSPEVATQWTLFLRTIREHWQKLGFLEVATPSLVKCPGFEPTIEPIPVRSKFLPTSPEIHLKKILAAGWSEIFEIRSCFRGGEFSAHHQPEFTMLEWYRSYANADALTHDLQKLLESLHAAQLLRRPIGKMPSYTVADLFRLTMKFELTPQSTWSDLQKLSQALEIHHAASDSWNDLFHRLWIEQVEPWLAEQSAPVIVTAFPPHQAALARMGQDGWAERVEMYWQGMEIANGFHELNDPQEQQSRAERDLNDRVAQGREPVPMDEDFLLALRAGMAPAAGMALGLERLFMAIQGIKDISLLKAFPYLPSGSAGA